jgi:crotonobetainyl-CoA:carnitine CoA-transferase CaiB-like acyl-CoA transferase
MGSRLPESTPNNLYPTADGEYIHITAMADPVFRRLATAMKSGELSNDPRFADALARSRNHAEIDERIGAWTAQHPLAALEAILQAHDVPSTRIFTMADIFRDPHYAARGSIVNASDDDIGSMSMAAVVPRLSATPGGVRHSGHRIGQDTRSVLRDVLGFDAERIDALARAGVIACDAHPATAPRASPASAGSP